MKTIDIIHLCLLACLLSAQAAFDSGSTGANGLFPPIAVPGGTTDMVIDMRNGELTFQPGGEKTTIPNTPAGGFADGTFNFTSMAIPTGVTLSFIKHAANPPICILAQTTVDIQGTLDAGGEDGEDGGVGGSTGGGKGGPGGYKGGNGELTEVGRSGAGQGPGWGNGGGISTNSGDGGSFATLGSRGTTGPRGVLYGQPSLLPIIGGSGAGGGKANATGTVAGGGGGGGGAVKIAVTETATIEGAILVQGGGGGAVGGGGGSGGAVRVIADEITGAGAVDTGGGSGGSGISGFVAPGGVGGIGRIRLEATLDHFTGTVVGLLSKGAPGIVVLPNKPSIRIATVASNAIAGNPGGVFGAIDVVIDQPGSVTIGLAAERVPIGTTITLTAKPESVGDVLAPVDSDALAGTFENSTASASITFPAAGVYFIEASTNFTLP